MLLIQVFFKECFWEFMKKYWFSELKEPFPFLRIYIKGVQSQAFAEFHLRNRAAVWVRVAPETRFQPRVDRHGLRLEPRVWCNPDPNQGLYSYYSVLSVRGGGGGVAPVVGV